MKWFKKKKEQNYKDFLIDCLLDTIVREVRYYKENKTYLPKTFEEYKSVQDFLIDCERQKLSEEFYFVMFNILRSLRRIRDVKF